MRKTQSKEAGTDGIKTKNIRANLDCAQPRGPYLPVKLANGESVPARHITDADGAGLGSFFRLLKCSCADVRWV